MAYNGSGSFSLPAGNPVVTGTVISSTWANLTLSQIATGLSTAILKDGQQTLTQNIPFNSKKITGLGAATLVTDAPTTAQVQNSGLIYLNAVSGTNTITSSFAASITPAALATAQLFTFIPANTNTGATTLAAGSLTAKNVFRNGIACVGGELVISVPVIVFYDGTQYNIIGSGATGTLTGVTITGSTLTNSSFTGSNTFADASEVFLSATTIASLNLNGILANGYFTVAAAANALTISVLAVGASTPSATDPVTLILRDDTLTDATHVGYKITAALSTVISSGSTGGCANSEVVRIHVGAMLNATTGIELLWYTAAVASSTGIKGIDPTAFVTTTAEGGAGGADTAQTAYSTTARTSQPWQYLGYFEATSGATAGQWASVGKIVNFRPGMPMPGDIVQTARTDTGTVATGTTTIPGDNTIPQIGEGSQFMTISHTQRSNLNFLKTEVQAFTEQSVNYQSITIALFKNGAADAIKAGNAGARMDSPTTNPCALSDFRQAGTTSPAVFTFRAGPPSAATTTFNGFSGTQAYGGVFNSYMQTTEFHI